MLLWLLEQTENNDYDTYSDCIVCAMTEEDAKKIHPSGRSTANYSGQNSWKIAFHSWASHPDNVTATLIGLSNGAHKHGDVICASFHAG